jgi:DNA-binding protein YbaB
MLGLDKLKEANRLRKMQSEIQKQLDQICATNEKGGVRVVVRGDRRIEKIEVDGEERKDLRDVINDAFKEVNKKVEKQMRGQLQDLGLPGL